MITIVVRPTTVEPAGAEDADAGTDEEDAREGEFEDAGAGAADEDDGDDDGDGEGDGVVVTDATPELDTGGTLALLSLLLLEAETLIDCVPEEDKLTKLLAELLAADELGADDDGPDEELETPEPQVASKICVPVAASAESQLPAMHCSAEPRNPGRAHAHSKSRPWHPVDASRAQTDAQAGRADTCASAPSPSAFRKPSRREPVPQLHSTRKKERSSHRGWYNASISQLRAGKEWTDVDVQR